MPASGGRVVAPRAGLAALAALVAAVLVACDERPGIAGTARSQVSPARLRIVHVAWPGRPLSDRLDREVLTAPEVRRALRDCRFERRTVDEIGPPVADVLRGLGTVALDADRGAVVAVQRGALGVRGFVDFVEAAAEALADHRALQDDDGLGACRLDLDHGLAGRALGRLEDRSGAAATLLRARAQLELGDVEAAVRSLAALPTSGERALLRARVAVADARPADGLALLDAAPGDPQLAAERSFWRGRALLDLGRRPEAYAVLERLAAGAGGRWSRAARQLLAAMVTNAEGHAHAPDPATGR